jgi:hypothetical protein
VRGHYWPNYGLVGYDAMKLSPQGWYYKFDLNAPAGERLTRKRHHEQPWSAGAPDFSLQTMTPEELRFVAGVIDEARLTAPPHSPIM